MPANLIKITALKKQTKVKTACMARLPGIVRPSSNTLQPDMPAAWNEKRFAKCLVLAKVDTFMNNKKCVKQCERVQQSTAMSSN